MSNNSHPVINKIHVFLKEWPNAEWGPAHIILSDYNLEDHWFVAVERHLEFAIQQIESGIIPEQAHSKEELFSTLKFLDELKAIPEDDRCIR